MAYVYRHIRLDKNEPFYIGIGNDEYRRRSRNKSRRNTLWKNISNKTDFEVEILFDDVTYDFAKEKEKEFIALYGRIDLGTGSLANMTSGGEGIVGLYRSQEYKDKIRNTLKGKKLTEKHKQNISKGQIGRIHSQESIDKMRNSKNGKPNPKITGYNSAIARRVLNKETNEIYPSAKYVADFFNISYSSLSKKLLNYRTNNTNFIYL